MRLSLPGALLVAAGGLTLLGIGRAESALGGTAGPAMAWPSVAAATLCAWMVAALAARWLGGRLGALAQHNLRLGVGLDLVGHVSVFRRTGSLAQSSGKYTVLSSST